MTISQKGPPKTKETKVVLVTDAPGLGLPNIGQILSDLSNIHQIYLNITKHVKDMTEVVKNANSLGKILPE